MKRYLSIVCIFAIGSGAVMAQSTGSGVASKNRDSSAAFIATQNFIVGRLGRDCLTEMGRSETPLEFQANWQKDNVKYYGAAIKYMDARLAEIEDPEEREAVEGSYYASVQKTAEAAIRRQFSGGTKNDVCKYAMTLIDTGSMNIDEFAKSNKLPIMQDLEELVAWSQSR